MNINRLAGCRSRSRWPSAPAATDFIGSASTAARNRAPRSKRRRPRRRCRSARRRRAASMLRRAGRSSTGTTRWCRARNSTSPASRRSWTWSWCRSTPEAGGDAAAAWRSARACSRTSACARRRSRGHAGAAARSGGHRRLQRARRGGRAGARERLRRAPVRARAARPGAPGPAARRAVRARLGRGAGGIPVRRAHDGRGIGALRRWRAPAHAPGRHVRRADRSRSTTSGKVQARFTVTAPIGGVVAELGAREGMTVATGAPLFRINGLVDRVGQCRGAGEPGRAGARREARSRCARRRWPGTMFKGKVTRHPARGQSRHAHAEGARRTRQSRGRARARACSPPSRSSRWRATEMLLVPSEAVIATGKRSVVIVAAGRRQVRAGRRRDRHGGQRADGDPQGPRGRAAGRRLRTVPDRLGSEPQGHRRAHGHGAIATPATPGRRPGARPQQDGKAKP